MRLLDSGTTHELHPRWPEDGHNSTFQTASPPVLRVERLSRALVPADVTDAADAADAVARDGDTCSAASIDLSPLYP